ncbi:MAG: FdtA/QdtA family cupin domain-containing protein [Deltaproteobacteria bacterium]|nr:FdtA/QdtA family cupin domain-containing protein [Deltaproteobacteria bacterium]
MATLDEIRLIDLPTSKADTGNVTIAESGASLPFELRRTYFLHGLTEASERGFHAHKEHQEIIVAASGSFQVTVEDLSGERRPFKMTDPTVGLYLPKMLWRELDCFTKGAICLVFCSHPYAESDYIRNYEAFQSLRQEAE